MLTKNFASFFGSCIKDISLEETSIKINNNGSPLIKTISSSGSLASTNMKRFQKAYVKDEYHQDGITLVVGNGTTLETIDDYKIESKINSLTPLSSSIAYSTIDNFDLSLFYAVNKTYKNNTTEKITVTEICLYTQGAYWNGNRGVLGDVLLAREVIDPIIIAPGETYTFSINIDL